MSSPTRKSTPGTFGDAARGRFLRALSNGATVKEASTEAGVSRNTAYTRRRLDEDFAAAWAEAVEVGTERLEAAAYRRAIDGSDVLMIFLLKSRRPEIYRERREILHTGPERPVTAGDLERIREVGLRPELAAHFDAVAEAIGAEVRAQEDGGRH